MNRGVLVGLIFIYFVLLAYMGSAMGISATDVMAGDPSLSNISTDITVWSLLGTFFDMVSFQVTIPVVLNLFLVYPALVILIWQIIEILKDLVPFT
ncbi:MAG: hypothetical protein AB7V50_03160 [Vampirovibrionia bacterium]